MHKLLVIIRLGMTSLMLHKLRSALAVLGILIGVTAVIWLVALGEGVSYQAQQQIKDLGATNIIARAVKPPDESGTNDRTFFIQYGLLRADYDRILANVPGPKHAVPMRELRREVRYNDHVAESRVVGCTPAYLTLNHLSMSRGRFLSDRDIDRVDIVVVLADSTAQILFPYQDPIGQTVQIGNDFYTVIGRMANRTPTAAIGGSLDAQDFNLDVYIPLSTLRWRIGDQVVTSRPGSFEGEIVELSQITVTVPDVEHVAETADIIRTLLKKYHRVNDYAVVVPQELLKQAETTRLMFNVLLVLIAGISLLVGGIGIMNIMLSTVTERTREIGIRRALGAKRRDIMQQFLAETIVLSATGGMLGVLAGLACEPAVHGFRYITSELFSEFFKSLPPIVRTLEPRIALWSVGVAFGVSVGVGVLFGLYPARRAAFMDPIEALRHE